ncbi:Hypothetical predicted protein [Scomber scombrus]|uniref:Uncharacterized protein n=1 Tax=Scomber scombrus TaxID=13677 RepID=A0AAV1PTE5_SCOSC
MDVKPDFKVSLSKKKEKRLIGLNDISPKHPDRTIPFVSLATCQSISRFWTGSVPSVFVLLWVLGHVNQRPVGSGSSETKGSGLTEAAFMALAQYLWFFKTMKNQ